MRRLGKEEQIIVDVYVDALIITGGREITCFKRVMAARFRICDLGLLSYYLGIEVKQGRSVVTLCQLAYLEKLVERIGMADCQTCATPMEEKLKASR